MIDIHCHVVHGVDDGPSSIQQSIRMVMEAEKLGIKKIIATPHFHEGIFGSKQVQSEFDDLKKRMDGCGIDLFLGHEVFLQPNIPELIQSGKHLTLGNSGYILLELPYDTIPIYAYDVIYKLHLENIMPIIAHPERNIPFVKNIHSFIHFIEKGCLIQIDAGSVVGAYGKKSKAFAKKILQLQLVDFVASDSHCAEDYNHRYPQAYQKIMGWVGEKYSKKLFYENPEMILK